MVIRDGEWSIGGVGEGLGVMSGIASAGCGLVDSIYPSRFLKFPPIHYPHLLHIRPLPSTSLHNPLPITPPSLPLVFPPLFPPLPHKKHGSLLYLPSYTTTVLFVYLRLHHTAPHNTSGYIHSHPFYTTPQSPKCPTCRLTSPS